MGDLGFRWGSCGKNGVLRFNWRLLQLPVRLIDYVIVHELVHIQEPHHSPEFWQAIDRALPAWRTLKQALCGDATRFLVFGMDELRARDKIDVTEDHGRRGGINVSLVSTRPESQHMIGGLRIWRKQYVQSTSRGGYAYSTMLIYVRARRFHLLLLSERERACAALDDLLVRFEPESCEVVDEAKLLAEIDAAMQGKLSLSDVIIEERREGP